MTERGAGMTVGGADMAEGARATSGGGSRPLTPHLTSPLEGGRDELGEEVRGVRGFLPAQE